MLAYNCLHRPNKSVNHEGQAMNSVSQPIDEVNGNDGRGWMQITTEMASHLPFSAAVEANGFIFVSGQASVDNNGMIVSGSFEDEMRRSMQNVVSILKAAGLTLKNVVRVTSYVHDPADLSAYNVIYREFFRRRFRPAQQLQVVSQLH